MSKITALCKRRGIVFQSSDIYVKAGLGLSSSYDYGPYGVELKNNISHLWWNEMTLRHDNIVGLDSAVIMHPRVWEASGHLEHFSDPQIDCKQCKARFKADDLTIEEGVETQCPKCGTKNSFTDTRDFNLMFQTYAGAVKDESTVVYLRPETCQGIFLNYKIVQDSARLKLPFGIAQIGKAYRNEITTGNFIFRTREFEQMEMQYFVRPGETSKWLEYWREQRWNWIISLGVREEKLHWYRHPEDKLAHYAKEAWDIEYDFPFGCSELEGLHDRGDFDLKAHQDASGKDMTYFDPQANERFLPHIVETSGGLNRTMLMLLCEAYTEDEQAGEQRIYLKLDPKVAPVKAAILPLVKKDGLAEMAKEIADDLRRKWRLFLDIQGSIGRRYRRMDELGTPFAFTLDYQTLEDGTVTVRWRDTLQQERIGKDRIGEYLRDKLGVDL